MTEPAAGSITGSVAILEPNHTGHRLLYVRRLVQACPDPVTVFTTNECAMSDEFQAQLADLVRAGLVCMDVVGSRVEGPSVLLRRTLRRTAGRKFSLIIPDADILLPALCAHGILRWRYRPHLTALVMRTPVARWPRQRLDLVGIVKALLVRILPVAWRGARLFFLSDAFSVETTRQGYRNLTPVPDPVPLLPTQDRENARRQLGVAPNTFLVGMVGGITASKHPDLVVTAMRQHPTAQLLVAGPTDAETNRVLDEGRRVLGHDRMIRVEGYLDPTDLGRCVSACDALVLAYDHDGPSSMLVSAVLAGVPVIAAGSPWVCRLVRELGVGVVTDLSADDIAAAVAEVMNRPDAYTEPIAHAKSRLDPDAFSATLLLS